MRDPWAKSHYTGPWNSQDYRWSPKLKEKLPYTDQSDGTFFVDIETFKELFGDFTIAYLHDDWHLSYLETSNADNSKMEFLFEVPALEEMFVDVHIYPPKMFPPSCYKGYPEMVLEIFHSDGTRKDYA